MFSLSFSPTAGAAFIVVLVVGYALYRAALPRPIPGIPYHKESAKSIMGDARDMMKHRQEHQTVMDWMTLQSEKLNTPVFQLLRPFAKPYVYCLDPRETHDVVMRRAKDFDKARFFADLFIGPIPNHHIVQPTNEKFRKGRRLLAESMSTGFLDNVAAPALHRHTLDLVNLWRIKNDQGAGHAFEATGDIHSFALDAIWATGLGSQLNAVGQKRDEILKSGPNVPKSTDDPATFPDPKFSASVRAMRTLAETLDFSVASPMPRQVHWLMTFRPSYRRALADKEKLIQESLDSAKSRLLNKKGEQSEFTSEFTGITCATDHMVRREAETAERENRAPEYDTRSAKDELYGFLVAGHDTTSTTMMWVVKLISNHPAEQTKLREALAATFKDTRGVPTSEQIAKSSIPYLDAVIEEGVRLAATVPAVVRNATEDTNLLGYHIPKGIDVWFMANGPGYVAPNPLKESISENVRSVTSRESKDRAIPPWDPLDISEFKPTRWIKTGDDGKETFDSQAGPIIQFGGGLRGCFGRKFAYLELRILVTLLVWTYELLPPPEKLNSFKAIDGLTRQPKQFYVMLKEARMSDNRR